MAGARSTGSATDWPVERKLRLFACGCCRQSWHRLAPTCRRAVRAAEWYADGRAGVSALVAAWRGCRAFERKGRATPVREEGTGFRFYLTTEHVHLVALPVLTPDAVRAVAADLRPWRGDSIENDQVDRAHDRLAADVFGGPSRRTAFDPTWHTDTAMALAAQMYESRDFSAMPILADALRDAGCDSADILDHCRGEGPHVRGCWVCDLVLGKE